MIGATALSPSFIRYAKLITNHIEKKICQSCFLEKENTVPSHLGEICPGCKKELETYFKDDEKAQRSGLFSSKPVPQSSPSARGWIHKFIEENNGVTTRKLITQMQIRDYSQSLINRQLDLVHREYEFDGENIIGLKPEAKIQMEDSMAKKKVTKKKGGAGRVNTLKDKVFVSTKKENPYRAESARGKAFEKLIKAGANGVAYSKELEEGNCLRDGLHKGFIKVKG